MTVSMMEMKLLAISDANARMKESDFFVGGASFSTGADLAVPGSCDTEDEEQDISMSEGFSISISD